MNNNFKGTIHKSFVGKLEKWVLENYDVGDEIISKDIKERFYKEHKDEAGVKELEELITNAKNWKEKKPYKKELKKIVHRHSCHTDKISFIKSHLFLKGMAKKIPHNVHLGEPELTFKEVEAKFIKMWDKRLQINGEPYNESYRGEIMLITKASRDVYGWGARFIKNYPLNSLLYVGPGCCCGHPNRVRLTSKKQPVLKEVWRHRWHGDENNDQSYFITVEVGNE